MQVTSEILNSFINCQYKAYLIANNHEKKFTDYHIPYNQLRQNIFSQYEKNLIEKNKQVFNDYIFNKESRQMGISLNIRFITSNINLSIDGIEFVNKNTAIPMLIIPFEKVSKNNRYLLAMEALLLQSEFGFQIETCKIIHGNSLKETKFKLSVVLKIIKKQFLEIKKIIYGENVPGIFRNNHCQICEFHQNCNEILQARDDLCLLTSLKQKEIIQKNNRGIFSVKQLSYTFRPNKNQYRKRKFLPELKALAIRDKKTFIQGIPDLKDKKTEVYIDIEGIPDRQFNYLIGVLIFEEGIVKEYSFWADEDKDDESIFIELIYLLKKLDDFVIYHYGSYEVQALKMISKRLPKEYEPYISKIIGQCVNILNVFTHFIYPPTYSNGLKEIAQFIGFEWSDKNASGLQSIIWRYNWELMKADNYKIKLLIYNIEDCKALKIVKEWIKKIEENNEDIKLVSNVKKENIYKWGITDYAIKDFEEINDRAYFNYQREHIFLRTEKKIYRAIQKDKKLPAIYNKIDAEVNLFPIICPYCRSKNITKLRITKKSQVDLVFMKQGIKKRTTLFTGGPSICDNCKKKLPATDMLRFPKYGHNLMIWSVNQKIQYRLSSENIVNLLRDSFKIISSATQITRFKELIATNYITTYNEIISEISKSQLIHIDETIAKIKGIDGYVWVFANYENVYYQFRETRETDFLIEILKDFKGVLITDFYTGYDALECRQQKCLVHLIRDLNEDFLKQQLDLELKKIVIEFGILLRSIIATIDKYGLKKFNLNKHKKDVDKFYTNVIAKDFESEFALSYQKRFVKYKTKLFEFLDYDGIPWNNNNAEYSIKPFAKWRKKNSKTFSKINIENHLVLLSILQTCKYRGINFFEFLKSGEISLSNFSKSK